MLIGMITSYIVRCARPLIRWGGMLGLLLWLGAPALAQRKRSRPDSTATRPGSVSTTTVRMEEETMFAEGMRFLITDEPTKAITQFGKVLQKNPANAAAQYATANALSKTGKTTDAVPYAAKAHSLDDGNKFYSLLLAELYVKLKRYGEAEELYEALLKKSNLFRRN